MRILPRLRTETTTGVQAAEATSREPAPMRETRFERVGGPGTRSPTNSMVNLAEILRPEELAQVDPMVVRFYENPTDFDLHAGLELGRVGKALMPIIAKIADEGHIPDAEKGFENYPMRQTLETDSKGNVHWHRMVQVNGRWDTLFNAKFQRNGCYITETFRRGPIDIPLTFKVTPFNGGIKLTMIPRLSSPLAFGEKIVFTTVPVNGELVTTGKLGAAIAGPIGELTIKIKERA